jgi:hypothetical protein
MALKPAHLVRRDIKRRPPSPILLHALCQCKGLLHAETPPTQAPPAMSLLAVFTSRLTSERWCLRSVDPVGFFIHLPSTVFSQVDFCSFSIFANIDNAMLEAAN